jgi:hypothetical protein
LDLPVVENCTIAPVEEARTRFRLTQAEYNEACAAYRNYQWAPSVEVTIGDIKYIQNKRPNAAEERLLAAVRRARAAFMTAQNDLAKALGVI